MNRGDMLERVRRERTAWDVVVIGGGATGLGCAVDAASRGLRTALFERADFAQETSSRSTKLVHGGVRYLRQGNVQLVRESLRERGLMMRNAPDLVAPLAFVVPAYRRGDRTFYRLGLGLYDLIAGAHALGGTRALSREETIARIPTVAPRRLRGGVLYHDASFDDARVAVSLALTATAHGAVVLNYARVTDIQKSSGRVAGVGVRLEDTGETIDVPARAVINATGVFSDGIRRLDEPRARAAIRPSRGAHIVLDRSFLPGDAALLVPHTDDGRVMFAIPWHGVVLVGTTESPVADIDAPPRASDEEIDFLIAHAGRHLSRAPARTDVRSVFAGLRPLLGADSGRTLSAALSRDHRVTTSPSGLVTVAGGKWTTYRRMAADAVDLAVAVADVSSPASRTGELALHTPAAATTPDARTVDMLAREQMALCVEDVLARRTRLLFTDAAGAIAAAPGVARALAATLGHDGHWEREQIDVFSRVARAYLP